VEKPSIELLAQLGWEVLSGFDEPAELRRSSKADAVLEGRLRDAVVRLNSGLDTGAADAAVAAFVEDRASLDPVRANKAVWQILRNGVVVQAENDLGKKEPRRVRFVAWEVADQNEFLAVSQFWVTGELHARRTDIVLFVNGVPLGFLELKAPERTVHEAYQGNLRAYRAEIPQLFWFNAFVILSNGSESRMGSSYAPWEYFAEWKKVDDEGEAGSVSLETMLRATCEPHRMLDIVENFIAYTETGGTIDAEGKRTGSLIKKVAKNHQYLGVNNALEATHQVKERDGRLGVFWHTQGSGKSLSMLWFTQKVLRKRPGNWTFVLVTDRKELDEQLFEEFADSGVITSGVEVHAETSAHLRELLGQDHRYVFTLIHKFIPSEKGAEMPVLSERDDIIVITDEAHRSQYNTLAANMRAALPNASFLGFTGTPLIEGEEQETKRVFGDYVSTYNFADSIRDGATVPLYYENRIPQLQLTNENFDVELDDLLDEAALDEKQEKAVARKFSQQYQLITRPKRLEEIAVDLVEHFANRGFLGKGMYVAIDKATAVRMYDLVSAEWARTIARLEAEIGALPLVERAPKEYQLRWMRETDMAVVVSQAQNEVADLAELGLDITPHRRKMNDEDLDSRFKDSDDPFRLVFVCAMWLTGFDAPSTSTIYLDKPMRGHTLMQTIARANRVFPDKDNGLIVDYIGVFRNLEKALVKYGTDRSGESGTPIQPTDDLRADLEAELAEAGEYLAANDIELADLDAATGFEFVNLLDSTVEALLIDEATRKGWVQLANRVRKAYKSLMPDPAAIRATNRVSIIRNVANKMASLGEQADISGVMDGVSELLDRSVGTREYIIRAAGEEQALLDLNQIDWEQLAITFAANKRTAAKAVERELEKQIGDAVRKNPTVIHLADQLRQLIADYNAGTLNAEEYLRRLAQLHGSLDEHQRRAVEGELTEAELAIFDLLTKPAPELTDSELRKVRAAAHRLLTHIEETLVLDWKKKEESKAALRVVIRKVLDDELPDAYERQIFDEKRQAIYEHVYASFGNEGESVYDEQAVAAPSQVMTLPTAEDEVTEADIDQANPEQFARMVEELYGTRETWALPLERLMAGEESDVVEFKTSARWDTDGQVTKKAPAVITKTIAGFANAKGGTLLIGVNDHGGAVGLKPDYDAFSDRRDIDKWLNWLTDIIINHLGRGVLRRLRVRIDFVEDKEICRIDIPALSAPTWSAAGKSDPVLYERLPNSTRAVPAAEIDEFLSQRFGVETATRIKETAR
jgi:type I restriction enzyme R subunit